MSDLTPLLPPSGQPVKTKDADEPENWWVKASTIRLLWLGSGAVLVVLVLLDLVVKKKPHFDVEGWFGFGAAFGFIACVALVVGSKALGAFLKRKDTFYDD